MHLLNLLDRLLYVVDVKGCLMNDLCVCVCVCVCVRVCVCDLSMV
jgi:hypothetical protein